MAELNSSLSNYFKYKWFGERDKLGVWGLKYTQYYI